MEDEATKKRRRRVEAYNNIIRVYTSNDYPVSKEQQEEVDRVLEEAKNIDNEIEDPEEQEERDEVADQNDDMELDTEEAMRYRAINARLNYRAVARADLQYSVKEAARHMSTLRTSSPKLLNKIGRYVVGKPRLGMRFKWQSPTEMVTSFADSDWAGCPKTAKSTSGGIVCIGEHVIKSCSRQQRVIALLRA